MVQENRERFSTDISVACDNCLESTELIQCVPVLYF